MFDEIKEDLAEINPFALLAVGLEYALIGYTLNHHDPIRAVYDYNKCLQVLMERDGMDAEGAHDFLSFNTLGAFVGTDGPLYVRLPASELSPKTESSDTSPEYVVGTDITARLTTWCHAPQAESAQDLMDEAAKEIERLRNGAAAARETVCPHVRGTVTHYCSLNFTLTDEEREAIATAIAECESMPVAKSRVAADTLRSLLERLK
jgi:hypothetical protein